MKVRDKLTLVSAARISSTDNLFEYAFTKTHSESPADEFDLKDDYDGFYRYWRYYPSGGRAAPALRWGLIQIDTVPLSHTSFKHWSYDVLSAPYAKYKRRFKFEVQQVSIDGMAE